MQICCQAAIDNLLSLCSDLEKCYGLLNYTQSNRNTYNDLNKGLRPRLSAITEQCSVLTYNNAKSNPFLNHVMYGLNMSRGTSGFSEICI